VSPRTITDACTALRSGEVTSAQLVEEAIQVADATDHLVGSFLQRFCEQSRAAAQGG
jgi:Asp-tRNA(Asn)/Glu-tRNA(Gln) amidotransferase A subunit family amidase